MWKISPCSEAENNMLSIKSLLKQCLFFYLRSVNNKSEYVHEGSRITSTFICHYAAQSKIPASVKEQALDSRTLDIHSVAFPRQQSESQRQLKECQRGQRMPKMWRSCKDRMSACKRSGTVEEWAKCNSDTKSSCSKFIGKMKHST